jgi:hypothetical protein
MKTTRHNDDGLEWLRALRLKIAAECGYDLTRQAAAYRAAAAGVAYKVYQGEKPVIRAKRNRASELASA